MHSRCPNCRSEYDLDDNLKGQTLNCVQCRKTFVAEEFTAAAPAAPKPAAVPPPKPPVTPAVKPQTAVPQNFYSQPVAEPASRKVHFDSSGNADGSPNPGWFWKSAVLLLLLLVAVLLSLPLMPSYYRYETHTLEQGEVLELTSAFGCHWELVSCSAAGRDGKRSCIFRQRIPFFLKSLVLDDDDLAAANAAGGASEK